MRVGDRIKERRKNLGLTADDLAEKLNVNRSTIYRYESNDIEKLPVTVVEPLAEALQTTPAYLLGWEENSNPPDIESNETIRHYTEPIEYQGKNIGIVPMKRTPLNNDLDELTQTMLELFCKLSTIDKCNVISYIEKLNQK